MSRIKLIDRYEQFNLDRSEQNEIDRQIERYEQPKKDMNSLSQICTD